MAGNEKFVGSIGKDFRRLEIDAVGDANLIKPAPAGLFALSGPPLPNTS